MINVLYLMCVLFMVLPVLFYFFLGPCVAVFFFFFKIAASRNK